MWNPFRQGLIGKIEAVQERTTGSVTAHSHLPHKERLKFLKLLSFVLRRKRADSIKFCPDERTRGHDLKLSTTLDYKHSFIKRVHSWNSEAVKAQN